MSSQATMIPRAPSFICFFPDDFSLRSTKYLSPDFVLFLFSTSTPLWLCLNALQFQVFLACTLRLSSVRREKPCSCFSFVEPVVTLFLLVGASLLLFLLLHSNETVITSLSKLFQMAPSGLYLKLSALFCLQALHGPPSC